jgi:hypothetical protein
MLNFSVYALASFKTRLQSQRVSPGRLRIEISGLLRIRGSRLLLLTRATFLSFTFAPYSGGREKSGRARLLAFSRAPGRFLNMLASRGYSSSPPLQQRRRRVES